MLSSIHFVLTGSKNQGKTWDELVANKTVIQCWCGKWVWKNWYRRGKKDFPDMDRCAMCFFK